MARKTATRKTAENPFARPVPNGVAIEYADLQRRHAAGELTSRDFAPAARRMAEHLSTEDLALFGRYFLEQYRADRDNTAVMNLWLGMSGAHMARERAKVADLTDEQLLESWAGLPPYEGEDEFGRHVESAHSDEMESRYSTVCDDHLEVFAELEGEATAQLNARYRASLIAAYRVAAGK